MLRSIAHVPASQPRRRSHGTAASGTGTVTLNRAAPTVAKAAGGRPARAGSHQNASDGRHSRHRHSVTPGTRTTTLLSPNTPSGSVVMFAGSQYARSQAHAAASLVFQSAMAPSVEVELV